MSLSFRCEMSVRNVTCIPIDKARCDLNASDAVFLPIVLQVQGTLDADIEGTPDNIVPGTDV